MRIFALILGIILGVELVIFIQLAAGVHDDPEDRYTVEELTDAIATREANIATQIAELEQSQ